jgi:hypothetical protein
MPKFLDASDPPDDDLVKEVYAHFGLCMYFAQVFETGLINILTALATAQNAIPTSTTFDMLYAQHERLTFGKLMKALSGYRFLPEELEREAMLLKSERDHLAHRFFRDHDLDFMAVGGCHSITEELEQRRERFIALDRQVSDYQSLALRKLGFRPDMLQARCEEIMTEMLQEARARFSSPIGSQTKL